MRYLRRFGRRSWATLVVGLGLASATSATWSIVAVDPLTGEVAVASATCLGGFPLHQAVPIIVVGKGGAASQSFIADATVKSYMYDGLVQGKSPIAILGELDNNDPQFQGRQFGIVDFTHEPVSFSGSQAAPAKPNVTGVSGTAFYAIQGNILTGSPVVEMAELAFHETEGDLGQRVMASMEAARSMGGDGRCSCPGTPTACGSPPEEFEKSAHVGFVYIARMGDTDGGCSDPLGCAQGDYYLELFFQGVPNDPDPVFELQSQYDEWRAGQIGRPDHLRSTVSLAAPKLVADETTATRVTVKLVDVDGVPLAAGGAVLSVGPAGAESEGLFSVGEVADLGNGSYQFDVTAGAIPGEAELAIEVDDGLGIVLLYPYPKMEIEQVAPLHVGFDSISASKGASVPLVVNGGAEAAGTNYLVLGSAHGTRPGVEFEGAHLPLNPDALLTLTLRGANGAMLPGSEGELDANGRAEGFAIVPAAAMRSWIGLRIHFASLIRNPADTAWIVSDPVRLTIQP